MGLVPRNWLVGNTTKNLAGNGKDQMSGRNLLAASVGFPRERPSGDGTYRIFKDKPHAWGNANLTFWPGRQSGLSAQSRWTSMVAIVVPMISQAGSVRVAAPVVFSANKIVNLSARIFRN